MRTPFEQRLRRVQRRCQVNLLLEELAWCLAAAGAAAAVGVTAERILSPGAFRPWALGAAAGLGALLAAGLWYRNRPGRLAAAVLIDRRLGLKERMSTTLALASSQDPFAIAARAESGAVIEHIDVKGKFPVRLTRRWLWTLAAWAAAAAVILFLPPLDLLGRHKENQARQEQARQLQQARDEVKQAAEKIDMAVRTLPDPSLSAELAKLAQAKDSLKAEDVKRQAIRKLTELSEQIKKMGTSPAMESIKDLRDMLKAVRSPPQPLLPELARDLSKGDFQRAADALRDAQRKLQDGNLSPEQQDALGKQLRDLGKQLEDLAARNNELKDRLQDAGLDKDLADLSEQEFKEALEKKKQEGMSQEKVDELLNDAEAARKACELARKLARCMKSCSSSSPEGQGQQISPEELAKLLSELDSLDVTAEGLASAEASLAEIEAAIAALGQGQGEGQGLGQGQGDFSSGLVAGRGQGTGGPGIGAGRRRTADGGPTGLEKTRVEGPNKKDGPIVAASVFKGPQVKGEFQKQLREIIQAGRDEAAEAINENEIPRKYEGPVKKYFGNLEESATQPAK